MAFSQIAVQARFLNADGSPASGTLCATPDQALQNISGGAVEESRQPICGVLDSLGRLVGQDLRALIINATDDEGTVPVGGSVTFSLNLAGQAVVEFSSPVPHDPSAFIIAGEAECVDEGATCVEGSAVIQLVDLVAAPTMVAQSIAPSNFSGSVDILSIDVTANTITVDAEATGTGSAAMTFTGGCVSLFGLQANAL